MKLVVFSFILISIICDTVHGADKIFTIKSARGRNAFGKPLRMNQGTGNRKYAYYTLKSDLKYFDNEGRKDPLDKIYVSFVIINYNRFF